MKASQRVADQKLGARERQILDAVYQLEMASVTEVRARLENPPSYSSVRTMLGSLETKGYLKRKRDGIRHLYLPVKSRDSAGRSALSHLMSTFFDGSASKMFAALLDQSVTELTDDELDQLQQEIDRAREEEK